MADPAARWVQEAAERDALDPLAGLRDRFDLDPGLTYLDGNSLGALPRAVAPRLAEVVSQEWGRGLIGSWERAGWWTAPQRVGDRIAPLVGADPGQVVVGDSTSVNLFRAVVAAARAAGADRDEIVVDAATFPTDGYVAASAARLLGATLRSAPPDELATVLSGRTAVVLLNHVDYRTGRRYDLAALTAQVHSAGAVAVWDLCHSAGAMPIELATAGADFAVGCTYKYLNGGPGAPAFLYLRPDRLATLDQPLAGWTSHRDPFGMHADYVPDPGVARARGGTPEILSLLALEAALTAWEGVELAAVRAKSLALTELFARAVGVLTGLRSVTPVEPDRRGSQVTLVCPEAAVAARRLAAVGVVVDHRPPDLLRFGFAPLYVRFADAVRAATALAELRAG